MKIRAIDIWGTWTMTLTAGMLAAHVLFAAQNGLRPPEPDLELLAKIEYRAQMGVRP